MKKFIRSTGCPAMDALNLAEDIRKGTMTDKEAIATLEHIALMVDEGHKCGEFIGGVKADEMDMLLSVGGAPQ